MKINGKQSVNLRSGLFKLKNYFKQLNAPFKIYPDFESLLKGVQSKDRNNSTSYNTLKNIKNTFLVALLIKLFVLMINLVNQLFFTEKKMQSVDLFKQFLKSMIVAKKL